jgi:hypothetical protein
MATGKLTLLQVVQKTLESLGSDEVNSINDSVEAEQVAQLAEDAYYELLNQKDYDFLRQLTQLESLADADFPNYLRIPVTHARIDQIKYDFTDPTDTNDPGTIKEIQYLLPWEFTNLLQRRNQLQSNVQVITSMNGVSLPIFNDTIARWWTSFDDEFVVFDSYDNTIESTLQGNNSQVIAKVIPVFTQSDAFTPQAPVHFFQTWLNEVKSQAAIEIKQEVNQKAEQKARRGLAVMRRAASRTNQSDGKVRFGRNARAGTTSGASDLCTQFSGRR